MSDPFKLRVLKALTECLKEITPANGYASNLADFNPGDGVMTARIYRGRAWFGDNDPLPMVSILEGVDPAFEVGEPHLKAESAGYDWPILIQGWVTDDRANPTDPAYVLLDDVRKRLLREKIRKLPGSHSQPDPFGLGGTKNRVNGLLVGPGVVRPADDVSSTAWFWLTLNLRIVDNPLAADA